MALLDHSPRFGSADAVRLAASHFRLDAQASSLPSERDRNFLLTASDGRRFVLKIANGLEKREMLEAENAAMARLAGTGLCPTPAAATGGGHIVEIESAGGGGHFLRMITYLPGVPMGTVKRHSGELMESLGRAVGTVDAALAGFDHAAPHRDFYWDLAKAPEVVARYRPLVTQAKAAGFLDRLLERFERETRPLLGSLPVSVIHNDANDYNVLAGGGDDRYSRNQSVVGLVDFGDMVHTHTVNGLAIAIAYAILKKDDPLTAAARIVRGYNSMRPLSEAELEALFNLVCLRLAVSVAIAADQLAQRPGDPYLAISQAPVRATLPRLEAIEPRFAHYAFRDACGLEPAPRSARVREWLAGIGGEAGPLLELGAELGAESRRIDLSVGSPLVAGDPAENAPGPLGERLRRVLGDPGVVGVGGYREARLPRHGVADPFTPAEPATLHLGTDVTVKAGTEVLAPLDGTVASFGNREDRGPTLVLRHETPGGTEFHTLYAHLDLASLDGLEAGRRVGRGERIGRVGAPGENGGQWPHLHFQLVADLLENGWEFPLRAHASRRAVWTSLCPDPSPLLGAGGPSDSKRTTHEIREERRSRIGRNLSISYREPLQIVRGWKQYLYDENGRAYLDAYNNVAHVGHSHPRVVRAASEQLSLLNTNTRYLQDQLIEYAARLTAHFPEPLSVCYFVNSGSEANELAVRLARAHIGRWDTIVLEAAYHGHTTTCIDLSPYKHDGPGGTGAPDWVHTAAIPDLYRGAYRADDPQAGQRYAREVGQLIERLREKGPGLCAYLAETCPSVAGQILLPEGYLGEVYRLVREAGGVAIADEVQTGFGRLGTHFWGFEEHDVIPDIVVLGKPIGNGLPLGAVVTTPAIAGSFDNGMEFFSTFGGSTASCVVGRAVLEVVEDEKLQAHALRVGERMLKGLRPLIENYPLVGDVRGSGLFLGVELVRDRDTLEPATEEAAFMANRFRDHGILLGTDGPHHNVIKIRGPMPFDESNADLLVETFKKILEEEFS